MIQLPVSARKITFALTGVFVLLLVLHLSVVYLHFIVYPEVQFYDRLNLFFNFDHERNFPTFFNVMLLTTSAFSFYLIGKLNRLHGSQLFSIYWHSVALLFCFLSMDEFIGIHEWFNVWVPRWLNLGGTGIFRFAWVIPYSIVLVLFSVFSFKILIKIPRFIVYGYLVSGLLYILGAVIIESLSGKYYESNNEVFSFEYTLYFVTAEESLEMVGLILLTYFNIIHLEKLSIEIQPLSK